MLILQRRKGQSLSINDNITLTVVDTGTDWVKLAIDAPKEVPILRSELKEAAAENQKASAITSTLTPADADTVQSTMPAVSASNAAGERFSTYCSAICLNCSSLMFCFATKSLICAA